MQRRKILKLLGAGLCLPSALSPEHSLLAAQHQRSGKRLILIELAGANDGLNTVVPITNDHYHAQRPTIGLSREDVIMLDDDLGLHQAMQPMMPLWDSGETAVVQGLGYPTPNRSHFKSIALWETGGDGQQDGRHGWITHDIEHQLGRRVTDAHGISFVSDVNLFASDSGRWLTMSSAHQFDSVRPPKPVGDRGYSSAMALVSRRMRELERSVDSLAEKLSAATTVEPFAWGELGEQLQQVVQLIRAGVDTPVFRVRLSGFDTHENQSGRHADLLGQLSEGLRGLRKVLKSDGEWHQTLVMTYSEFGRRAMENDSGGTDHGTAAPHLVIGGAVHGGLYGQATDLSVLVDGDPAHTLDYRALYERVLGDWFDIAGNRFAGYRDAGLDALLTS